MREVRTQCCGARIRVLEAIAASIAAAKWARTADRVRLTDRAATKEDYVVSGGDLGGNNPWRVSSPRDQ